MLLGLRTAIYQVKDIEKAKDWFTLILGKTPYFDEPFYVGFNVGGFELGLQPDEEGINFGNASVAYWGVKDAKAAYEVLVKEGSIPNEPVTDVGGGILIGTVIDPSGNVFGIIENPHFNNSATE